MLLRLRNYNNFLSNGFACKFEYAGLSFTNVESALQSAKAKEYRDKKLFTKLGPSQARYRGRLVKVRDNWHEVKEDILYNILYAKFNQNDNLKFLLLDTQDIDIYNSKAILSTDDIELNKVICDIVIKVRGNIMG